MSLRQLQNTLSRNISIRVTVGHRSPPVCSHQAFSFRSRPSLFRRFLHSSRPLSSSRNPSGQTLAQLRTAQRQQKTRQKTVTSALYFVSITLLFTGLSYAAVPLYRAFCSATGFGGTPITSQGRFAADKLVPREGSERRISVRFNADSSDALKWKFTASQKEVKVRPGETALAFFRAKNWGEDDIIGIATYNVTPDKIAPYFAKVECFCFEEQRLLAGEEVDLPVFFFIDRDMLDDPAVKDVNDVILSYTFFKAKRNKRGDLIPDPSRSDVTDGRKGEHNIVED
ncbi:hypothetical protein BT69DRAFT_1357300 [Atractiella rhizophila]|nr:hypothetical protein BT69DRAFT_1357300 [Atractiella rhizophila]